jgi:hypothetical protein
MTDSVLTTEIANTPVLGSLLTAAGNAQPSIPIPNVITPYVGTNVNTESTTGASPFTGSAADLLPLASIGAVRLNVTLNNGGQTGPASILAAMSTGALYALPASSVTEGAVSISPVSTGKTAPGNPNAKVPPAPGNGGIVGANVP